MFNVEDHILVGNLKKIKGYGAKKVNFLTKVGMLISLNYLLKKLRETGTIARQPGSGRRRSAHTVENVDTVNDLVLSHKCIKPHVKLHGRPTFLIIYNENVKKLRVQKLTKAIVRLAGCVTMKSKSTQNRCGTEIC